MSIKEIAESNSEGKVNSKSSKLKSNNFSESISKILDSYDIEVLDAHLEQSLRKNKRLSKRIEKLEDELELMTKCLVEMVEKNYRLEEEIKNLKKEDPL